MDYQKITISPVDENLSEILVAILENANYEGFEELPNTLLAYISSNQFDVAVLDGILFPFSLNYTKEVIAKTNWNETWENNFQPVVVNKFCTVRAEFHQIEINTPFEIVITPKMSFGTGHHATTQQMMRQMKDLEFKEKKVFDFGTGTGILSILSKMLGAANTIAIDNDEWSVLNALENIKRNNVAIEVFIDPLERFSTECFDIILANINRNILLENMELMSSMTVENGYVLMSGLLVEDQSIIEDIANANDLKLKKRTEEFNWISLLFQKQKSIN